MSISRVKTWSAGETLTASDLNAEYNNILSYLNSSTVALTTLTVSGSSTLSGLLDISGASAGQVKYPATQNPSSDANTLDDYEEAPFTPTLTFGGAAVGMTGTFTGKSTKVGNRIDYTLTIVLTAKGSSTGGAIVTLGTLPAAAAGLSAPCAPWMTLTASMTAAMAYVLAGANTVSLFNFASNTATAMDNTNFGNTTQLAITGVYWV